MINDNYNYSSYCNWFPFNLLITRTQSRISESSPLQNTKCLFIVWIFNKIWITKCYYGIVDRNKAFINWLSTNQQWLHSNLSRSFNLLLIVLLLYIIIKYVGVVGFLRNVLDCWHRIVNRVVLYDMTASNCKITIHDTWLLSHSFLGT